MLLRFSALLFVFFPIFLSAQSFVERVDPPCWWVGIPIEELQIMVYGQKVGELNPIIDYPGIDVLRTVPVSNANYAFIYVSVAPETKPGTMAIQWRDGRNRTVGRTPFEWKPRQDPARIQGYSEEDAVYLITPDRFANGNSENDDVAGMMDSTNRIDAHGRHGGDLAGIEAHLEYIKNLGMTAIWLNPVLENRQSQWSYHGYSTTDFYRVDPRFGSNADYQRMVASAREKGIKVIMDMIMNHCGSGHWWMEDLPDSNWINNPNEFVPTTHRRTSLRDPYAADGDVRGFTDGWFVETMPDLNQRHPLLADYLIQNTFWWIEYLGLSGIRMDTYSYSDKDFMRDWTCAVMEAYPTFNMCGEEWSLNPSVLSYWQRDHVNADGYTSCLPGLLDFPLRHSFMECLLKEELWHSDWIPLYEMLGNDYLYAHPSDHIIFPDNHDMSRIHAQLGDDVRLTRLALYFFATMRGTPQFYYGTEILMSNTGDDSHGNIRSDFPGGWEGDAADAITGKGLSEEARTFQEEFRKVLHWRQSSDAVHHGALMHFVPEGGTYVYFRYTASEKVMVLLNKSESMERLSTNRFQELLLSGVRVRNPMSGEEFVLGDTLEVPALSPLILEVLE